MVSTCKSSYFSCGPVGILVKTVNQSIKNQPCIWLMHGSGGISSNEDIWIDESFKHGFTVIIVDSYSNRGVFKQNWEHNNEKRIDPFTRALDQIRAYDFLSENKNIIKFADLDNSIAVGFSDGGTGAIWLQNISWPKKWKKSYCLYPATQPELLEDDVYDLHHNDVHLFVGDNDDWCPTDVQKQFQEKTNCKLTVWPNVYHSYSKPGISQWHQKSINNNNTPGVYCEYNEQATKDTMEIVFNELD